MAAEIIELNNADQGGYAVSRYNATRHGILSRHTVLPWEDRGDYDSLLQSLESEYQPATPTEHHLVEELAGIMWRKARVRQAEGSAFQREAAEQIGRYSSGPPAYVSAALVATKAKAKDLKDGIASLAEELSDGEAKEASEGLAYWQERQQHFEEHGRTATMAILDDEGKAGWKEHRQQIVCYRNEHGYEPHTEDEMFADWLEQCLSFFQAMLTKHQHTPAIRQQIIGLSYATDRMDGIARYETHLDRKFERVLAMLLKLKEMQRLAAAKN